MAQKPDTGPLLDLPPGMLDLPARRHVSIRSVLLVGVGIACFITLALFAWLQRPAADTRPVEVVRGFAAAIEARDVSRMLAYVEPTDLKRQVSPELRAYLDYLEEVRFSNAQYQLLSNDGQRAEVRWTAAMTYRINYGDEQHSGSHPVDTTFVLTNIEGAWYLASVALPETGAGRP
ncbi:MAG TPA: hypothetical protein PKA05_04810 [Roseiflexaceae bacterium]|nr:hypothetical protein [Roseiflexaceae bacterium]HMP39682.1 hypothetical protein [Roseiflexaceae bacterium]